MSKNKKQLYIFTSILIIFLFSVFWIISDFGKEENAITTTDPRLDLVKAGVETTTPKSETENPPLPARSSGAGGLDQATAIAGQGGVESGNPESLQTQENAHSVTILAGDITTNLQFAPNTLFYDALVEAKGVGTLNFSGKNYPGLGFFVTDIGTLHAGGGKDLLYYINGKEASVGVSLYTLKDGDIIEWKLE